MARCTDATEQAINSRLTPLTDSLAAALRSPLLPLWLVIALLPFGRSAELGTLLCLIGALIVLWRAPGTWREHPGAVTFALMIGCYIAAAALSAFDAAEARRSWGATAGLLRYVPLGLYACYAVHGSRRLRGLYLALGVVLAAWVLDAWVQALTGWSLAGRSAPDRLTGIFGADNLKLGPALAVLSPFLLWAARARGGRSVLALAMLAVLGPVLLSGARSAWIIYAVVVAAFLWREAASARRFAAYATVAAAALLLAGGIAWQTSTRFDARIQRSLALFGGSEQSANQALAGRLDIWATSGRMIEAHPWLGVGVRDFRYAYPSYAPANDHFVVSTEACGVGEGACHPHQLVLEVLADTGVIGLLLWLAGLIVALRYWRTRSRDSRALAFPATVALAAMLFPLNTHLAFYSAWWGLLFAWLLALWCAALAVDGGMERSDAA